MGAPLLNVRQNLNQVTTGAVETFALGSAIAQTLRPGDVIALEGELGAGKTQFVKGLAQGLGHDPSMVSSPTYVLVHEYSTNPNAIPLVHIDAYRLTGETDESTLGLDHAHLESAITAIEWPQRIASIFPNPSIVIEFKHLGPETRRITVTCR